MILTKKQTKALDFLEDSVTTELLYGGAAGGGKSQLGCYWQLKRRMKYPGTRGLIGRASLSVLKVTTLQTFYAVAKAQGIINGKDFYQTSAQDKLFPNSLVFENGSIIYLRDLFLYPSDPDFDDLGSLEITDAFIDEGSQVVVKAKDTVRTRLRYNLIDGIGKILTASNPAKNWMYRDFYRPSVEGTLEPDKKFVQSLPIDNPHLPESYLTILRTLKDKNQRARLWEGNWDYDDDPAKLMDYDCILNLFTNEFIPEGKRYLTVDVARKGKDKSVIGLWSGFRLEKIVSYDKNTITELCDKIKAMQKHYSVPLSNVVVDEDGVGGGVVDFMKCEGFVNNSSPLDILDGKEMVKANFDNLKSQCYWSLADKVNENGIYIATTKAEEKDNIIEELENVKDKGVDKEGKRGVLPKDKVKEIIGRSPDYSDMIMQRMYFELKPKGWTIGA